MRWLGAIYSLPTTSSRWLISTVDGRTEQSGAPPNSHCPVCATSAQPLEFGVVHRWGALSSCCTGQSGATPDSPVTSDFAALTSTRHYSSLYTLCSQPLAREESLLRWLTGQSGGTPARPVNYSRARLAET
jgi:hypothetical protein